MGGYATSMVDPEIGITIRQVTSGLTNLLVLVPLFAMFGGADAFTMVRTAFTDTQAMPWFAVAGFGAYFAFMLWYKGNAMCGTALGMSCQRSLFLLGSLFLLAGAGALVRHRRLRPGPHRLAGGGGHGGGHLYHRGKPGRFFQKEGIGYEKAAELCHP